MIETERLVLRPWREAHRAPFAAMMADPEVAYWLGGTLTGGESAAHIERMIATLAERGFGILAMERKSDGAFVGSAGLAPVGDAIPFAPAVEVGWRLARSAWGQGYATEAARAVLADGLGCLGLPEIVSFTAESNRRSRAVMERLGLTRDASRDFEHPKLAVGHPLRPHVVYFARP